MRRTWILCLVAGIVFFLTWANRPARAARDTFVWLSMPSSDPHERTYWRQLLREHPRVYSEVRLRGDEDTDHILMQYAAIRIAEIYRAGDTMNGVKFIWSDSLSYGEFQQVWILAGMHAVAYMVYGDSLWVLKLDNLPDTNWHSPFPIQF